jgi:3-deoxy-manno-octulosonate cytidylyltransferase (CMP-KDO synthetase)
MLAKETGKYLLQHTYEQATKATLPTHVFIATDDDRIRSAAKQFGARCIMTAKSHQSGTDRIAEAVQDIEADIVVNLQGDEPGVDPGHIDHVAELLLKHQDAVMATLAAPLTDQAQVVNPNIVKVIRNLSEQAIYFSRAVIPYDREASGVGTEMEYLRHLGIYAYRRDFLMTLTTLPQTPLERTEKLEQLRVLEHGFHIRVGIVSYVNDGIDTPEQYKEFVRSYTESIKPTSCSKRNRKSDE